MTAQTMLAMAASQEGYRPNASGETKYGVWFADLVGDPVFRAGDWCAMGLLWCAAHTGQPEAFGGAHREWAWVPSWGAWFQDNGRFGQQPRPGAVVFFDWDGSGTPVHVGLAKSSSGGTVTTIEFNTLDSVCAQRDRSSSLVFGYGYPNYPAPTPPDDEDCWVA